MDTEPTTVMIDGFRNYMQRLNDLSQQHSKTLSESISNSKEALTAAFPKQQSQTPADLWKQWFDYGTDAWQRSVLTMDVLRQRGNAYNEVEKAGAEPVLDFDYEIVMDGRNLPRPVNYSLLWIKPPSTVTLDPTRRPFMIIDPRAGHGAGIGGFKPESQVGEAFEEGHCVYFVTFSQMPVDGQTLEDVRDAEIAFIEEISKRHPSADKPALIGNCQGGWASMILAAEIPDHVGPISINGSPMSYWAGENGKNPMRYTGGLAGGAVPALLMADLGNGIFDGALLVENFENLNPANTHMKKLYNLYSNVDSEAGRFLEFERWWGGFYKMTEAEIRWIVENLFVGNKLAHGLAEMGGKKIDLRQIKSPIIVFASKGDNITPPPQALNWIADLYRDEHEIKVYGQRIIYIIHETIGHLGIFVSAKVAGREHDAIADTMRAVEALPPGLYEMVLEQQPDRMHISFAPRTMDDILKLDDGRGDEEMFAAVNKMSEAGVEAYERFMRPIVKPLINEQAAAAFSAAQPIRMERALVSDANPLLKPISDLAEKTRAQRMAKLENNVFQAMETALAKNIEASLNMYRDMRDAAMEMTFHTVYGQPWILKTGKEGLKARAAAKQYDLRQTPEVKSALAKIEEGGEAAATARILQLISDARGYVRRSRLEKNLALFEQREPFKSMSEADRAKLIHEQAIIVDFEREA
ncbi:MAG: DUF3141 domain-containing protein, partial [Notoacmeibacter sp.]